MKKLFIIGNGFDVAHKLPTKYSDFQDYLMENYPEASDECLVVPESFMMPDGDERYNDDEVVGFLLKIITETEATGEAWGDLENTLGRLDFDECFDDWNDDDDDNKWHKANRNEYTAANISGAVKMIKEYFSDWIETIDIYDTELKIKFYHLIDNNIDLFLTFNYTETLEEIYEAKNVYHIHGKQGSKVVFGHGNNMDNYDEYMNRNIGSENHLSELQAALKKDTQTVINQNKSLFKELGEVDEIYSYGFSFSDVDIVYIKEICNASPTENIVWYIHDYNSAKFDVLKEKIIDCGFKGKFDMFTV
ncbi:bacteriophage abortive infection AbiH family protein [Tissierella sp. MB52-C2]|uniref:bacteriophage abortive infection AbiH family protein n=1 Tax=Tissierella sp. MB52-C2 TaxID=3070999 RepID=UPI00280C026D|nr:bacteriophage abortive infection AbiH family protein [Tissierella sp. MB52-C2]WMM26039.1 bacteriophage abortive infection AbiH family protein [Tissierella sp. MB52-C2]